ncbi:MAG: PAS domain-containing protein, partial [Bacteroidia bacterium]|nr:PAS domain-containing protein [Bacteroidia bacterium]
AEGLPNNQINDLFQDKNGNLWIATMYGVCRFDGQKFHQFDRNSEISINPVKTIYEDSKENLWFGTIRKGVCKYDGTNFTWYTADDGLLSNNVNTIAEDRNGNIWIGTSEGLSKYNGELFQNYTTLGGLIDNNVYEVYIDKLNNVWIGTLGGISKITGNNITNYTTEDGLFSNIIYNIQETSNGMLLATSYRGVSRYSADKFKPYISMRDLPETRVQDITEDFNGNIWLATNGDGVIKYSNKQLVYLNVEDGLPHNNVTKVIEDREGNFWFGTKNGLSKYSGDRFTTYTVEDGISENNIQSVFPDSKGRIWLGTLSEGINIFRNGKVEQTINTESGLKSNTIWSIIEDTYGDFWIGTTSGVARYNDSTKTIDIPFPQLDNLIIHAMLEDKNGQYLFGTDEGLYIFGKGRARVIKEKDGLKNLHIRSLYQDHKGDIWVGTLKGMYVITKDEIVDFNEKFDIIKAPVTSIIEDKNGNIAASTYDYGVIAYIRSRDIRPFSISTYSGFISNRILFNFLDRRGQLWLGTPDGIDCIDWDHFAGGGDFTLSHFDKYNGYYGVETNAAAEDSEGNVWFGTVNGVIRYNASSGKIKIAAPLTNITNIKLFLQDVDWDSLGINRNIKTQLPIDPILAHNQNYLSFEFIGIYLTAPDEIKYRFMLEGFEEDWSPLSNQTIAHYSNLGPGVYTFKVQASPNEALWSETASFSFTIEAPFWKTPFFYVLYFLLGAGILWLFLLYRTRSLQKARNFLQQKVNDRTKELNEKNIELAKLSLVASETDNAVLIFNKQRKLEWVNEGFTKMTGYTLADIKGDSGEKFDLDQYRGNLVEQLGITIHERRSHIYEGLIESKEGKKIWTSSTFTPIFDDNNELKNVVVIDTDIS